MQEKTNLIEHYGGTLVNPIVQQSESNDVKASASTLPSIKISSRSVCDLELFAGGSFSSLNRFIGKEDHQRTLDEMRFTNGSVIPIPITLPVNPEEAIKLNQDIALRDANHRLLAFMNIEEVSNWDHAEVAE